MPQMGMPPQGYGMPQMGMPPQGYGMPNVNIQHVNRFAGNLIKLYNCTWGKFQNI